MAKDINDLTPEQVITRIGALKKLMMWFALAFTVFGFAVLLGVMDIGLPAQFGWIFIGFGIVEILLFQFVIFPKIERKALEHLEQS